jgi:hypothetical protein
VVDREVWTFCCAHLLSAWGGRAHGEVSISVGNMCSGLSIMLEVPDPPRLRNGVRDHSLVLWWLNRWVFNTQLLRPRDYPLGLQPSSSVLNIRL